MSKVLYFDTETTGLIANEHSIVQLAVIVEVSGKAEAEQEWLIKPDRFDNISPEALKTNGRTIEELRGFPEPATVLPEIKKFLARFTNLRDFNDRFTPAGHNVNFDIDFLEQFCLRQGVGPKEFHTWIERGFALDTKAIFSHYRHRYGLKVKNAKLVTCCEYFGIPLVAHDAMNDIRATRELYLRLIDRME